MIKVYKNNKEFLDKYRNFLEEDEVKNNLIIGVAEKAKKDEGFFVSSTKGDSFLLGVITFRKLILSSNSMDEELYLDLVEHMNEITYPGVIGEKEVCLTYVKAYQTVNNKSLIHEMDQRIYYCDKVLSESDIDGVVRLASMDDFSVLRYWINTFYSDVEGNEPIEETDKELIEVIKNKRLYVLEHNGEVVAMTGKTRPLTNSETICLVYTPKQLRKNGYASKLVEEVTKLILTEKEMVTLYTDLANPTSNSIYMKIGFKPYCDSLVMSIE
jgi:uncharacterized protein